MKVSIQGNCKTKINDMFIRYFGSGAKYETGRHQIKVPDGSGGYHGVTRSISSATLVVDMDLILHIYPENEQDFEKVLNGLKNPAVYPSLGRYGDLLRIDTVSAVEIEETDTVRLYCDAYIPEGIAKYAEGDNIGCSKYLLNKKYEILRSNKNKGGVRVWEKVNAFHYGKGNRITARGLFREKQTEVGIFWA